MNNAFVRDLMEVAGRDMLSSARNEGKAEGAVEALANTVVKIANKRDVEVPEGFLDQLRSYASKEQLEAMVDDIDKLSDDVVESRATTASTFLS